MSIPSARQTNVVIAGGGVAGVEALLARGGRRGWRDDLVAGRRRRGLRRPAARHRRGPREAARDRGPPGCGVAAARVRARADDRRRGAQHGSRRRDRDARHARARTDLAVRRRGERRGGTLKFGGLATHQARAAASAIARLAGAEDAPDVGEPVLHGRLLVGRRTRRLRGRGDAEGAPLWWPHGKVAGEYLPRWLAEHGVAPPPAAQKPPEEGVVVTRPMRPLRGAEATYLRELARQFGSSDPAIAALRAREAR